MQGVKCFRYRFSFAHVRILWNKYYFLYFIHEDTWAHRSQVTCSRTPQLASKRAKIKVQTEHGPYLFTVLFHEYLWKDKLDFELWSITLQCDCKYWNTLTCLECVMTSSFLPNFQTPRWHQWPRQLEAFCLSDSLSTFTLKKLDSINLGLAYSFLDRCD